MRVVKVNIFLLSAVFGIAILFYSSFYSRGVVEENFNKIKEEIKESEWIFLWGKIEQLRTQALDRAKFLSREIETLVNFAYKGNMINVGRDLSFLDSKDNKLINLINFIISKSFMNLDDSDSDDPFVVSDNGILSDFSIDCSSVSRSRSFEEEVSLHWNKELAHYAISRILSSDESPFCTGWQFTKPKDTDHTFRSFNEKALKDLYFRFGIEALSSFEFLEYVRMNEKRDLAGRPYSTGKMKNGDSVKLIIVQGFNPAKQILNSKDGASGISFFKEKLKACESSSSSILSIFNMLLFIMILIIIMVYLVGVSSMSDKREY